MGRVRVRVREREREGEEKGREEKRREERNSKRENFRRKKIQVCEKVGKSQHCVFPMICGSGGWQAQGIVHFAKSEQNVGVL